MRPATQPHAEAILSRLREAGITVGLSKAPQGAARPYVVMHPSTGTAGGTLADPSVHIRFDFQLTCVGDEPEQALWMVDVASAAINRYEAAIPGRAALPIVSDGPGVPVARDDATTPPLYFAVTRWRLTTLPA